MEISSDHHLGLEAVTCFNKYFTHQESKLHSLIDDMERSNIEVKVISDVMNKLSHAKQKKEPVDFSNDEMMKRYIAHIHKNNPTIFEELVKNVPDHLFPIDKSALVGEQITVENLLHESLENINVGNVKIDILTEDQIAVIVQGLDGELKKYAANLNESMMKINEGYDNRIQMSEATRRMEEKNSNLSKHINSHMAKGG